jgi:hypothetical protein
MWPFEIGSSLHGHDWGCDCVVCEWKRWGIGGSDDTATQEEMIIKEAPNPGDPEVTPKKPIPHEDEPPKWFTKYAEGIFSNRGEPPARARKIGREHAQRQWKQPYVRDRFKDAVQQHQSDMYSLIFGN